MSYSRSYINVGPCRGQAGAARLKSTGRHAMGACSILFLMSRALKLVCVFLESEDLTWLQAKDECPWMSPFEYLMGNKVGPRWKALTGEIKGGECLYQEP